MKLLSYYLMSIVLATASMSDISCSPEQTNISFFASQLHRASQEQLIPIVIESDCVCTVSLSRIRAEISTERGADFAKKMSEKELAAFAKRSVDYSGQRLSKLMKNNCWFNSFALYDETNCILKIRTYEKAMLGWEETFDKIGDCEDYIVRVILRRDIEDSKRRRPLLEVSRNAEKRIKEADKKFKEEVDSDDNMDVAIIELSPLLTPVFYRRHSFSVVGDDDTTLFVKNGDDPKSSVIVIKGTKACVTNLCTSLVIFEMRDIKQYKNDSGRKKE